MSDFFHLSYEEKKRALGGLFGVGKNYDFVGREYSFTHFRASLYFIDSFIKSDELELLLIYLADLEEPVPEELEAFAAKHLPGAEVSVMTEEEAFVSAVLSGTVGMIFDLPDAAGVVLDLRSYPTRGIEQSENDRVLRGAHDSFVETIKQNTTLIRRRIRDPRLTFEKFSIGERSKTDVVMAYLEGEASDEYVKNLRAKLNAIRADALTLGQQSLAECLIKRGWYDPFPKFRYTERPDMTAAQLLEGNVVLLCDTSPEAMILPTCLFDFMQETDDYYFPPLTGSYLRLLRYAVFFLTMLLTPTWYLLISDPSRLPAWLGFLRVRNECEIPIIVQLFLIEFALDGLKLASMNTPSSLNNTFGVVGGLILGDFAVQIGWFVPEVIVCMAFVAIAGFTQSSYELGYAFKFMRMMLLLTTALFGVWGYFGGLALAVLLAASNRTVNGKRNYLYPLIPFNAKALKRLVVRERLRADELRPRSGRRAAKR